MEKTIVLRNLRHRNQDCIGLYFSYQKETNAITRSIPDIKFSITNRCWYVVRQENTLRLIVELFQKNKIRVDSTDLEEVDTAGQDNQNSIASGKNMIALARSQVAVQLKLKGYSDNTARTYEEQFKLFTDFFPASNPEDLGFEEIQAYMLYLIENRKLSKSTQNQAINAIKFYYEKVLRQDQKVYYMERPFKEKKLPNVLSQEEVWAILATSGNLKHRVMLMLIYSAGLRRSELLNLTVADLDFFRFTIRIRGGKGMKDRQTILARNIIPMLKQYLEEYNPRHWLFVGFEGGAYSASSLQKVLKNAVHQCGIKRPVTLHTLRHSFATHLLESGTSTRYIQVLLGHESPKTTEIYTHVTKPGFDKLKSPFDMLAIERRIEHE